MNPPRDTLNDQAGQTNEEPSDESLLRDLPGFSKIIERLDRLWDDRASAIDELYDLNGKELGKYTLREVIGRGSFGVVYLAVDTQEGGEVALKIPRPEVMLQSERLDRFRQEALAAASLDHPSIVRVFSAELDGPAPHIASAYCAGPDLGQWLSRAAKPVEADPAARCVQKLADAVQHAHDNGILHRDVKPSNVMLHPDCQRPFSLDDYTPKLTDFGLAKIVHESLRDTRSSTMVGTPLYMAPEQVTPGGLVDSPLSDVYALGVLLFELLTKRTPLEGLDYYEGLERLRTANPPRLEEFRADPPKPLAAIVDKCLQLDPADRYPSAAALAEDLRRYLGGQATHAKRLGATGEWLRWMRLPKRLVTAGWFAVAFQSCVFLWMLLTLLLAVTYQIAPAGGFWLSTRDWLLVSGVFHLPKALLGWRVAKLRTWAYPISTFSSVLLTGVFVYSAVGDSLAFEYNYPTRFSKINNFSILILGSLIETGLHLLALPAWLKLRRAKLR